MSITFFKIKWQSAIDAEKTLIHFYNNKHTGSGSFI